MAYLKYCSYLLPALTLIIIYLPTNHFFSNQYDDAYITYRYAVNLAEGSGLVFNIDENTDAASSFLYTVILSIGYLFGLKDLELLGGILGLVSLSLVCVIVFKISAHLTSNTLISCFVALMAGLNGFLAGWALSGMETLPWTLAVTLCIYLLLINAKPFAVALAFGAAAFIRLEGIFLIIPVVWFYYQKNERLSNYVPLSIVTFLFFCFYIIKYSYYDVWISHAFKMKALGGYYAPNPSEVIHIWLLFGSVPFVLGLVALGERRYRPILAWLGISVLAILTGPKSDWSRYSVHLLPIFYAFSAVTVLNVWQRKFPLINKTGLVGTITLILLFAQAVQSIRGGLFGYKRMTELASHQVCRKQVGDYIKQNLPVSAYIASGDIGAIAYKAINHRFVDISALTSSDVLQEYMSGRTVNNVLEKKAVTFLANTFTKIPNHDQALQTQSMPNDSDYYIDKITDVLFVCSADEYDFKLVRMRL
jgi:hypothetical protein